MKKTLNILTYILVISILAFSFYPSTTFAKGKMPKGSEIGSINVQDKTDDEMKMALDTEIALWKKDGATITLMSEYEQFDIPRDAFHFEVDETIQLLNERTKRTLTSLFMRQKNVSIPFEVVINEADSAIQDLKEKTYINYDGMVTQLEAVASKLGTEDLTIDYTDESAIPLDTIAEVKIDLPTYSNAVMTYALEQMEDIVIGNNEQFSLLNTIQFPENLTTSNKELSIIATALYELFLQSNFIIAERQPHLRLPTYAEAGTDVKINRQKKNDLIVINKNDRSMRVEVAREDDDTLTAKLLATPTDVTYELDVETMKNVKQRTVKRYSKELLPGSSFVLDQGAKGLQVAVHREQHEKGVFVASETMSEDLYLPNPKIIVYSAREAEELSEDDIFTDKDLADEVEQQKETFEEIYEELEEELEQLESANEEMVENESSDQSTGSQGSDSAMNDYYHPSAPTIAAEIERVKKMQLALEEQFKTIDKLFEAFYYEKHHEFEKELDEKFDKINEQIDEIMDQLLMKENGGS